LVQEQLAGENSLFQCGEHWYHDELLCEDEEEKRKRSGNREEQVFKVGFSSEAHVCVNIPTSLSVMLPLDMDLYKWGPH
jgi:hypothetical protein